MKVAAEAVALGFFLLLSAALLGKLDAWESWSRSLDAWLPHGAPYRLVRAGVPVAEIFTASLLVIRPAWGFLATGVLLGGFGIAILGFRSTAKGTDCGCFGAMLPSRIGKELALRDLILAAVAVAGFAASARSHLGAIPGLWALVAATTGILLLLLVQHQRVQRIAMLTTTEGAEE